MNTASEAPIDMDQRQPAASTDLVMLAVVVSGFGVTLFGLASRIGPPLEASLVTAWGTIAIGALLTLSMRGHSDGLRRGLQAAYVTHLLGALAFCAGLEDQLLAGFAPWIRFGAPIAAAVVAGSMLVRAGMRAARIWAFDSDEPVSWSGLALEVVLIGACSIVSWPPGAGLVEITEAWLFG